MCSRTWQSLQHICCCVILQYFLRGVSAITDLQMTTEYHHYQVLFLGYRETVSMQGRCAKTPLESNKESSRNAGPSLLHGRAITPWVQKEDGDFNVRWPSQEIMILPSSHRHRNGGGRRRTLRKGNALWGRELTPAWSIPDGSGVLRTNMIAFYNQARIE